MAPCQNSEKSNDPIPRKHPRNCQVGKMDRPYFIELSQLEVSWIKRPLPFLTTPTQKSLKLLFAFLHFHQHVKNQFIPSIHFWGTVLRTHYFIDLFQRYGWLKNWLAENILAHISGTKIFLNLGFMQEHEK